MHNETTAPANQCRFTAELELQDRSSESAKTAPFRMVARGAEPINHHFWGPIVHDNHGVVHKGRIPIDFNHNVDEVIGFANHIQVDDDGNLEVRGALTPYGDNDRATEILYKAEQGVPWESSINFAGDMVCEQYDEGEAVTVNGRDMIGPLTVVREWQLRGVAVTPYGYDSSTSTNFQQDDVGITYLERNEEMDKELQTAEIDEVVEAADQIAIETEPEVVAEAPAEETTEVEVVDVEDVEPASLGQTFMDIFGEQRGAIYFTKGVDLDQAKTDEIIRLRAENAELSKRVNSQADAGESAPLTFSSSEPSKRADKIPVKVM